MDIKFKLLIVDDDIRDKEEPTYQKLERKIKDLGLIPEIDLSNGSDYKNIIKSKDYDLYLIDYSLVNDIRGNTVIKEVRDNNRSLTDIVLYSTTDENLYKKLDDYELDGVYVCKRDKLYLKAEQILEKLEKRTLNPLSLRGIVLHNYSDIEFRLRKFLLEKYQKSNKEIQENITEKILEIINEGKKAFEEKIKECQESEDFVQSLFSSKTYLFDMGKKLCLLEYLRGEKLVSLKKQDINLLNSLNKKRNTLGHSKILEKNGAMVTQDINNVEQEYTGEKCKYIKEELKKALAILDELEGQI